MHSGRDPVVSYSRRSLGRATDDLEVGDSIPSEPGPDGPSRDYSVSLPWNQRKDAAKVVGPLKRSWKSFLDEHDQVRHEAERLPAVADMVGEISSVSLKSKVDDVYGFLSHRLLPHISVEEGVLYPAIARAEGLREAGEIMRTDHVAIASFVRELASARDGLGESLGREEANRLRRVLYGLDALVRLHMGKEEQICLPALEKVLPRGRVQALIEEMELFEAAEAAAD